MAASSQLGGRRGLAFQRPYEGIPKTIETAIFKGGWPTDSSIFKDAATVVILSDGGGRQPLNKISRNSKTADKGVGLVCVHYAVEVPKGTPER